MLEKKISVIESRKFLHRYLQFSNWNCLIHFDMNWCIIRQIDMFWHTWQAWKCVVKKDRKKRWLPKSRAITHDQKNTLHYSYKKHISIDPEGDICWSPFKVWILGFAKYRQFWPLIKIISKWILNFYSNTSPKLCAEATKILDFRKIKFFDVLAPWLKLWLVMFGPLRDQDWKPNITVYNSRFKIRIWGEGFFTL